MTNDKATLRLTDQLGRYVGWAPGISATASELVRAAQSYSRIQERWCSEEMSDETTAKLEARETKLERKITDLVWDLPTPDEGRWSVRFEGDPRGHTVRIVHPDGAEIGVDQ
jgi:membrane protein implicated in regulation of membrane protease activity